MESTLAARIRHKMSSDDYFCSFEVSPPKSEDNYSHLLKMISNLQDASRALFTAISWHQHEDKKLRALELAAMMQEKHSVLLHLSGTGLNKALATKVLQQARDIGIGSIFALRGDRSGGIEVEDGFPYAIDLVKYIRQEFHNNFTVCVAGYPDAHPNAVSFHQDLMHLKNKVDAGADFIITQFCFQADMIIEFVRKCRQIGISVPIIPGIFPIQDWESLQYMATLCHVNIPQDILLNLESIQHNPQAIEEYGIQLAVETVNKIFASRVAVGVHFFTLNRDTTVQKVLRRVGFHPPDPPRSLPCGNQTEEETK